MLPILYYDVPLFLIIKFSPTSLARSIRIPCSQILLCYGNEFFFVVISSCPRGDCLWINYRYLLNCHPDTEIFSKRRKIYSICLDSRDDNQDLTVRQLYKSRTSDRQVCQLETEKFFFFSKYEIFLQPFFCKKKTHSN